MGLEIIVVIIIISIIINKGVNAGVRGANARQRDSHWSQRSQCKAERQPLESEEPMQGRETAIDTVSVRKPQLTIPTYRKK